MIGEITNYNNQITNNYQKLKNRYYSATIENINQYIINMFQ